jgi:hypothetical protein
VAGLVRTGDLLLVKASAAGFLQRRALQGEILVVSAEPGVADEHGGSVANIVAKVLPSATDICNSEMARFSSPLWAVAQVRNSATRGPLEDTELRQAKFIDRI